MTPDEEVKVVAQMAAELAAESQAEMTPMRLQAIAENAWALFDAVRQQQAVRVAAQRPKGQAPPPIPMR